MRPPSDPPANPSFERKVTLSSAALFFERMWPRIWALLALAATFVVLSLLGFWPWLSGISSRCEPAAIPSAEGSQRARRS